MSRHYLVLIGEREALAWVLREQRMAFARRGAEESHGLEVGDELFLVTTRGCFHNPGRDRTRIIGQAVVKSAPAALEPPITLMGREFSIASDLEFRSLSAFREGLELAPLVAQLTIFPKKHAWSAALRRTLVPLPESDAALIEQELDPLVGRPEEHRLAYLDQIRPVRPLTH